MGLLREKHENVVFKISDNRQSGSSFFHSKLLDEEFIRPNFTTLIKISSTYNLVHNNLEFFKVLIQIPFTTSKTKGDFKDKKLSI